MNGLTYMATVLSSHQHAHTMYRLLTCQEWTRLGRKGQTIVWNKREKGRGGGRGQQSTGRRMEDLEPHNLDNNKLNRKR